jgi:hypothetical protein
MLPPISIHGAGFWAFSQRRCNASLDPLPPWIVSHDPRQFICRRSAGVGSSFFTMKKVLFSILVLFLFLCPRAPARAQSSPEEIGKMLEVRGLTAAPASNKSAEMVAPPAGVEVDERVQTDRDGQELSRIRAWDEPMGADVLHVQIDMLPTQQRSVAYWVFPKGGGCAMFGWTMYDNNGRPLKSSYWRNDPALKVTGGASFPPDLYPDTVPPEAFLRVLGTPRQGASSSIRQQISPYGLLGQNVDVQAAEKISVPAGTFDAYKVSVTPQVGSLMPSWPGFVLKVIGNFVPRSTYYFEAKLPYRLLKQEGTLAAGGPEVITQLQRYYIEGARASSESAAIAAGN